MDLTSRWKNRKRKESEIADLLVEFNEIFDEKCFDPDDYVERLSLKIATIQEGGSNVLNACGLQAAFETTIRHLQLNYNSKNRQCAYLEVIREEKEKRHYEKTKELIEKNNTSVKTFQELDTRIDFVATKVVHLGDLLQSVNTPRARAVEAQTLMYHFADLLSPDLQIGVLNDRKKLYEAADIIQKLHLISQELPSVCGKSKFNQARQRIAKKYNEIECELIEEFDKAHQQGDIIKMKETATILSHFKGYSQCIDAFIEQRQQSLPATGDILTRIVPSCVGARAVMMDVFINPEQVLSKYILNIFHGKLQDHIQSELEDCSNLERYLVKFERLYSRTMKLTQDLMTSGLSCDTYTHTQLLFLNKLTKNIFAKYLDSYIQKETCFLKEKFEKLLNEYYSKKNHQKKTIHFGGIHDLRRDIQARIGSSRANLDSCDEILLSEQLAMNFIIESKRSFHRCSLLSKQQSEISVNVVLLFDILLHGLFEEHVTYALELGLITIPLAEPKSPPEILFFDMIRKCNIIYNTFEKQFVDTIVPLVISTPQHTDCLQKKKKIVKEIEIRLHTGLDRCISSILGWAKFLLQSEQKKTDFKPETEMATFAADKSTSACSCVIKFITECVEKIKVTFDGKNVKAVLTELGTRLHRLILDHLQQFQYSSIGAMVIICDLNEYRRCVREFEIPLLNTLFETLHALCNLLVVEPSNLAQMCSVDQLACLDRTVLMNFVQLRADYKTAKLVNQFR